MNKDTKKLTSLYEEMVLKMVKINDAADEEFDPEELRMGIEDEREHTDDIELAKSIAKDHLQNESDLIYEAYMNRRKVFKVDGKPVRFARFGGLSPVPQKGFKRWRNEGKPYPKEEDLDNKNPAYSSANKTVALEPPSFHTPPARKGIYAFVWPYIDLFLLNGTTKWEYEKDHKGEKVYYGDWTDKDGKPVPEKTIPKKTIPKMRVFDYYGDIWHHLKPHVQKNKILAERGDWVKTSFETFVEALKKEVHSGYSMDVLKDFRDKDSGYNPNWKRTGKPFTNIGTDHLEVFIEDIH